MSSVDPPPVDHVVVDVGIPTHGRPVYLGEAIESVLGQTLSTWRLTISENGPGSVEVGRIVEPYLSDRRVCHVTTGDEGLGGAGNATRLIRTGNAPYVGILHDDDRWSEGFLARRVAFLDANPACGVVFSSCDIIDGTGAVVGQYDPELGQGVQPQRALLRRLYRENIIPVCSVLVRRSAYEAVGPAFNQEILFWDWEMWVRLAARFAVGFEVVPDSSYRLHGDQTSKKEAARWWEHCARLLIEIDRLAVPGIPRLEWMRTRYATLLRASVEAHRRGDSHAALRWLAGAFRTHALAPLDPVMIVRMVRLLAAPAGSPTRPLRSRRHAALDRPAELLNGNSVSSDGSLRT